MDANCQNTSVQVWTRPQSDSAEIREFLSIETVWTCVNTSLHLCAPVAPSSLDFPWKEPKWNIFHLFSGFSSLSGSLSFLSSREARAEQTGRQRALFRPPLGGGRGSEAAAKSEVKSQSRQNEPGSILGCLMSHFSQTQHWESLSLSPLAAVTAWLNSEPLAAELIWEQLLMQLVERREAGPAPPSARRRNN